MSDWYQLPVKQALEQLEADPNQGLTTEAARLRLEKYGSNELEERGVKSPWEILFEQFTETMVIVLIVAAVVGANKDNLVSSVLKSE